MKLGQAGTGSGREMLPPIIAQAISMGEGRWASWTRPRAGQSTAHLGLAGALVFLGAGLAKDTFKTFLSTYSASLDG